MIKVGLVSDLHSEFWSDHDEQAIGGIVSQRLAEADFILLPGDIGNGVASLAVAKRLFPHQPVFLIAGNHEFYRHDYTTMLRDLQAAAGDNIHFLHQSVAEVIVRGTPVRIIGTTLWTDFDLHLTNDLSLFAARRLNDFRLISFDGHILTPQDTLVWHREQRAWLFDRLNEDFDGISIVMTHHAPVSFAIGPRYITDPLSPCFASRMETLLLSDYLPLVVWGHTHHCLDRTIEGTRFVSNQTGYSGIIPATETGEYGQIVELASG